MHYFSNFETKFSSYLLQYTFSSIDYYVFFNLYLFEVSSKSTFSLLFGTYRISIYSLLFLSIDSQPCPRARPKPEVNFGLGIKGLDQGFSTFFCSWPTKLVKKWRWPINV